MMNKKPILKALSILLPISLLFSCQEEIEENDLLEGKWRESSVLSNEEAEDCAKQSYMEFSKYTYEAKERKQVIVNKCSGDIITNAYSLKGDTIITVDDKQITKRYIIRTLEQTKLTYIDKDGISYTYLRW